MKPVQDRLNVFPSSERLHRTVEIPLTIKNNLLILNTSYLKLDRKLNRD
jgi:hypothetical protein